jgi:streptogramin lyase
MKKRIIGLVVPALLLAGAAAAQEETERFIPIGKSPGVSGISSMIGTIQAADAEHRTITVESGGETMTVRIAEDTSVWIDRSAVRQTNLVGNDSDLEVGRTVEVKYVDDDERDVAEWVKVAVASGG